VIPSFLAPHPYGNQVARRSWGRAPRKMPQRQRWHRRHHARRTGTATHL